MLEAVLPLACVNRSNRFASALSVALAVGPTTFICFASGKRHFAIRVRLSVAPLALVDRAIHPAHGTLAVPESTEPVALVNGA